MIHIETCCITLCDECVDRCIPFSILFYRFPCAETAKLLIRCGANVNAMDNERNTPLHVIVSYRKHIRYNYKIAYFPKQKYIVSNVYKWFLNFHSGFLTLHSIIMELIEAGAHMDIVNSNGKTPYDAASSGTFKFKNNTNHLKITSAACETIYFYIVPSYENLTFKVIKHYFLVLSFF